MKDFYYRLEGDRTMRANQSWYRGDGSRCLPSKAALRRPGGIAAHILDGWRPPAPFISRETGVTAFGSCFAQHISRHLRRRDYRTGNALLTQRVSADFRTSHVVEFGEGIVNSHAILQQFQWAFEARPFSADLWEGSRGELAEYSESIREATAEIFANTDVFILTLGLSELWFHRETGEALWRAIPRERFDPALHGFRFASFAENLRNLEAICDLIHRYRPSASIIWTLSPIPLVATFRPMSCVTANEASKATLRAAIDELIRERDDPRVHYWPAYEIVRYGFADGYGADNRHLAPEVLGVVLGAFEDCYLVEQSSDAELASRRRAHLAELEAIPGVGPALAAGIEAAGWFHAHELAVTRPSLLEDRLGLSDLEAGALVQAARALVEAG